jgi:hypothetical protein
MELAIVITVGVLFSLLGLVCIFLVVLGLPGTWIMLALALCIEIADTLYLPEGDDQTFRWRVLLACVVLAAIGELLEFFAGMLGARTGGSSKRGMWGALIGGIGGGILGIGIPLPIIGPLIGAAIGTFIGAILGELTGAEGATVRGSLRPATGATIGRVLGTLSKIPIAVLVWATLTIAALWP